ncbi:hypothetical protein B0H13DRAFT_1854075 [Mycena leptocephala]|nr:hypothetical protein B0H13DRAFT_1854075 [Mycena leptocephala]
MEQDGVDEGDVTLERSGNRLRVKTAMRFEIFDAPADALRGPARVVLPLTLHRAESCSGMVDCSGYATATCKYHWRRGMGRKRARGIVRSRPPWRAGSEGVKHADIQVEAPERIQVLVLSRKHSDGHAPEVVGQVEMEREIVSLSQISAGSTGADILASYIDAYALVNRAQRAGISFPHFQDAIGVHQTEWRYGSTRFSRRGGQMDGGVFRTHQGLAAYNLLVHGLKDTR